MIHSYRVNNPLDMIHLAKDIAVRVYWNSSFYLENDEFQEKYKDFWDILESEFEEGDILSVEIDIDSAGTEIVRFIRRES